MVARERGWNIAKVNFSSALAAEYRQLYKQCEVRPDQFKETDRVAIVIVLRFFSDHWHDLL